MTVAAAPAGNVIAAPTSAPKRPGAKTRTAASTATATAIATARRGSRGASAVTAGAAPEQQERARCVASSSLPIPKKRTPKAGFGPSSERAVSGEPAMTSIATAPTETAAAAANAP